MSPWPEEPRLPAAAPSAGGTLGHRTRNLAAKPGESKAVSETTEPGNGGRGGARSDHPSSADPAPILQGLQKHPRQPAMPLSSATFGNRAFLGVASHPDFAPDVLISLQLHEQHGVFPGGTALFWG